MTEEIVKAITEAETRAAEIKVNAQARAAEIAAAAETRAAEIEKSSEEVCKAYRRTQIKAAEADAQKKYAETLTVKKAEAEAYAERVLRQTEIPVSGIVGRIIGGDR